MRRRQILVVEDSDEDFDTVHDAARQRGLQLPLVRARSGSECLRLLGLSGVSDPSCDRQRSRDGLPLLLLLDLNTPGEDGRDVLRQVRSHAAYAGMPVVVLSASANPRDLQYCYAHGANAYHVKPVAHALHLQVLKEIFDYWLGSVVLPD
jgi:CheY-like chemotaxis protein